MTGFSAGTYNFRWRFSKNSFFSQGYDTVWLDDITWPGGSASDFETDAVGTVPGGFTSGSGAVWSVVSDGVHARGASGNSVKAGAISDSQETYLDISRAVGAGDLTFWVWVSSEQNNDFFELYVDGSLYFQYAPGQYGHDNAVGYPASNPDTIAVGASNDGAISGLEERSYYSQFGAKLDVVAPSSGGGQGTTTTDRMGPAGYDPSNYYAGFGGTSSAAPLTSGAAADLISYYPALTAAQIRTALHGGADKIGPYTYPGGRNDYYGYGRVNLLRSLEYVRDNFMPVSTDTNIAIAQGPGGFSRVRDFDNCGAVLNITIPTFGAGLNPDGAIRVAKGDVTGDGAPEIVTGTYGGSIITPAFSRVRVFDLAGTLLTTINTFGPGVNPTGNVDVGLGDLDMDGINEIIVGAGDSGSSRVRVFDETGAMLDNFMAYGAGLNPTGLVNVSAGDADTDGVKEIIAGTGGTIATPGANRVRVFDLGVPGFICNINAYGIGLNPSGHNDK